jgi:opacity protein-like surface antigen
MKKFAATLVVLFTFNCAFAQESRFNFNVGGGPGFQLGQISNFANTGGNFVVGAGPNFGRILGVNGEFMYYGLPINQNVLAVTRAPSGSSRMYSVTGNAIVRVPTGGKLGAYGIGGLGWYHRSWELTAPVLVPGTVCGPNFFFWGVTCVNGLVPANAVLRSGSSNAFGLNIGGGVTYRLGESHAKIYGELRYHHAYTNNFSTSVLPLTFGVRW